MYFADIANGVIGRWQISLPAYDLRVDFDPDRAGSVDLAGATVRGDIHVFLDGDRTEVRQVEFLIDGKSVNIDRNAPWDLVGGNANRAQPFDTKTLAEGTHSISAIASFDDGRTVRVTDDFTVDNLPDGQPAFDLRMAHGPDLAASDDLQSATLTGDNNFIFLEGDPASVTRVEFLLDGEVVRTERSLPWTVSGRFGNADRDEPFDISLLRDGEHSVSAIVTLDNGGTVVVSDGFQVDNPFV
jgi:hypothetical protein